MVGVRLTDRGQEIGFQWVGWSAMLGLALGGRYKPRRLEVVDGEEFLILEHDRELDRFLRTLIDLLIHLRYLHPTMIQLELSLTKEEAVEMKAALSG
jgi:hypothetical protein